MELGELPRLWQNAGRSTRAGKSALESYCVSALPALEMSNLDWAKAFLQPDAHQPSWPVHTECTATRLTRFSAGADDRACARQCRDWLHMSASTSVVRRSQPIWRRSRMQGSGAATSQGDRKRKFEQLDAEWAKLQEMHEEGQTRLPEQKSSTQ
ncbi:hypothetical protein FQR65_LT20681 [Abscondita terminalis]|nr:hypothetical protein FQR65_LT20681 [Abscondita terminalis]